MLKQPIAQRAGREHHIVDTLFLREHGRLETLLEQHLLAVIGGEFMQARAEFAHWQQELQAHIAVEEQALLPQLPMDARWAAKVYLAEHERITLLAQEYAARLAQVLVAPPKTDLERRRVALCLIDAAHPMRHVLDHHHQREHQALAHELPNALLERIWGGSNEHA